MFWVNSIDLLRLIVQIASFHSWDIGPVQVGPAAAAVDHSPETALAAKGYVGQAVPDPRRADVLDVLMRPCVLAIAWTRWRMVGGRRC
jgi:hypothetical protein